MKTYEWTDVDGDEGHLSETFSEDETLYLTLNDIETILITRKQAKKIVKRITQFLAETKDD